MIAKNVANYFFCCNFCRRCYGRFTEFEHTSEFRYSSRLAGAANGWLRPPTAGQIANGELHVLRRFCPRGGFLPMMISAPNHSNTHACLLLPIRNSSGQSTGHTPRAPQCSTGGVSQTRIRIRQLLDPAPTRKQYTTQPMDAIGRFWSHVSPCNA